MRLFFHLVDKQDTIHDLEGVEVADLEQARTEAMRALAAMRGEDPAGSSGLVRLDPPGHRRFRAGRPLPRPRRRDPLNQARDCAPVPASAGAR